MTNHETAALRAVLTVTVETRPDGGHYFDQADFAGHVAVWVRSALRDKHAVGEVTVGEAAAVSVPPPAPRADDRAALRDRIAGVLADADGWRWAEGFKAQSPTWQGYQERADAVLAVLPAAVSGPVAGGQQNETPEATLAAALDGLHTLIATSSRDWGQYRVDAWLWAVLCGWDCEEGHEHDELCDDGAAMREMAAMHSWDDDTVAKARRYRAAVRALTKPAAGVRQDGAQS